MFTSPPSAKKSDCVTLSAAGSDLPCDSEKRGRNTRAGRCFASMEVSPNRVVLAPYHLYPSFRIPLSVILAPFPLLGAPTKVCVYYARMKRRIRVYTQCTLGVEQRAQLSVSEILVGCERREGSPRKRRLRGVNMARRGGCRCCCCCSSSSSISSCGTPRVCTHPVA